jgi:phosphate starvation-inducible PhoH-like protein
VEAGKTWDFFRRYERKLDPYMQPLYDALRDMLPNEKLEDYIQRDYSSLAFMRGLSIMLL